MSARPWGRQGSPGPRSAPCELAVELFSERGYSGTSTRQIAERAGISESLIYTNFGSKRGLFEQAVVTPIHSFLEAYIALDDKELEGLAPEDYSRKFLTKFLPLLFAERSLLTAYLTAPADGATPPHAIFQEFLDAGAEFTHRKLEDWGYPPPDDPWLLARMMIAMQLGLVVFSDWLFPSDRPSLCRVVNEITAFHFHGVQHHEP